MAQRPPGVGILIRTCGVRVAGGAISSLGRRSSAGKEVPNTRYSNAVALARTSMPSARDDVGDPIDRILGGAPPGVWAHRIGQEVVHISFECRSHSEKDVDAELRLRGLRRQRRLRHACGP